MAQATPPNKPAAPVAKPVKKSMGAKGMFIGMVAAVSAVAMMPTTLLVVVGMIPTAVAYFVDNSKEKSLGPVIFYLNFAGVLPSLLKLWKNGHTVANSLAILMDPMMLALMLVPAACGWMLYAYIPYLVTGIIRHKAEMRIRTLEKYQQELIDHWGHTVSGAAKPELTKDVKTDVPALSA